MIFAQARCFHAELRIDFSGEHLPRMTFHPFPAAQAAAKMSPISAGSTRSSDTLTLLAYSAARPARSRGLGARSRMRA
jgi:hypothetical protein